MLVRAYVSVRDECTPDLKCKEKFKESVRGERRHIGKVRIVYGRYDRRVILT